MALYGFVCVVRMKAECLCCEFVFVVFLFIVCFVFFVVVILVLLLLLLLLLHFLCQGFVALCVCIVRGHYVIAHVVYVLLCRAHDS